MNSLHISIDVDDWVLVRKGQDDFGAIFQISKVADNDCSLVMVVQGLIEDFFALLPASTVSFGLPVSCQGLAGPVIELAIKFNNPAVVGAGGEEGQTRLTRSTDTDDAQSGINFELPTGRGYRTGTTACAIHCMRG